MLDFALLRLRVAGSYFLLELLDVLLFPGAAFALVLADSGEAVRSLTRALSVFFLWSRRVVSKRRERGYTSSACS
jgi:hypothetical protein